MAQKVQIQRSSGSTPPSSLLAGELAYVEGLDQFYIGLIGGTVRAIGSPVSLISFNNTQLDYSSSVAKNDIVNFSLPAGTLGLNNCLHVPVSCEFLNGSGSTCTLTFEIAIGATVMYADVTVAQTSVTTTTHPIWLDLYISNANSLSAQKIGGLISMGTAAAATTGHGDLAALIAIATGFNTPIAGTAAENSATALTIRVSVTMSVSNALTKFSRHFYYAELVGKGAKGDKGSDIGVVAPLTLASGVMNIDCNAGPYYALSAANFSANVTSITFSNLPASGLGNTLMVQIQQNASAAKTMAWPASFKWAGGSAPAISTGLSAKDLLALTTFDQGTTWLATLSKAYA